MDRRSLIFGLGAISTGTAVGSYLALPSILKSNGQSAEPTQKANRSNQETVIRYFFWIGCNSCKEFTPKLKKWSRQNPSVSIIQSPVAPTRTWMPDALFAQALITNRVYDQLYQHVYNARQQGTLNTRSELSIQNFLQVFQLGHKYHDIMLTLNSDDNKSLIDYHTYYFKSADASSVPAILLNDEELVATSNHADTLNYLSLYSPDNT